MYEFAGKIVGKCLYESSLGRQYRQLVKARFSRSFLAQLMGLRVTYKVSIKSYDIIKGYVQNNIQYVQKLVCIQDCYQKSRGQLDEQIFFSLMKRIIYAKKFQCSGPKDTQQNLEQSLASFLLLCVGALQVRTLFLELRLDFTFMQCNVYTDMGPPV